MKKVCYVLLMVVLPAFAMDLDTSDAERTAKPFKYGPLSDLQRGMESSEDNQLVASWMQLMLLGEAIGVVDRFKETSLWKFREGKAKRYVKALEFSFKKRSPKELCDAYRVCFAKINADHRLVPGFGNERRALIRPDIMWERVKPVPDQK